MQVHPPPSGNDRRLGVLRATVSLGEVRLLSIRHGLMIQTRAIVWLESTHLKQFSQINMPERDEQATIPLPEDRKRWNLVILDFQV